MPRFTTPTMRSLVVVQRSPSSAPTAWPQRFSPRWTATGWDRGSVLTENAKVASYCLPSSQFTRGVSQCRRGYFIGAWVCQFALTGAVDRLRSHQKEPAEPTRSCSLCDPANQYGAALPWPDREGTAPAARRARWCAGRWRISSTWNAAAGRYCPHRRSHSARARGSSVARSVQQGCSGSDCGAS